MDSPHRAVVIDDEPDIHVILRRLLPRHGFEVVGSVYDGAGAVDVVRQLQPDVVLLDLRMPTSGEAVLPDLRVAAPFSMVIVVSAEDVDRDARQRLQRLGADGYHHKSEFHHVLATLGARLEQFRSTHGHLHDGPAPLPMAIRDF